VLVTTRKRLDTINAIFLRAALAQVACHPADAKALRQTHSRLDRLPPSIRRKLKAADRGVTTSGIGRSQPPVGTVRPVYAANAPIAEHSASTDLQAIGVALRHLVKGHIDVVPGVA